MEKHKTFRDDPTYVRILGTQGPTDAEQQVPLAHQFALAGLLVAAAYLLDVAGVARSQDNLISINPMRRFPAEPTRVRARMNAGRSGNVPDPRAPERQPSW